MRRTLLALLCLAACRDFDQAYANCFDGGPCVSTASGGGSGGAGGGTATGGGGGGDAGSLSSTAALCFDQGAVCWEAPYPSGFDLEAVYAVSPREAWFVGDHGVVVHWLGEAAESFALEGAALHGVAGDGARVLAVSDTKLWDLKSHTGVEQSPVVSRLATIHQVSAGDIEAGADRPDGTFGLYRVSGTALEPLYESQSASTRRVVGLASRDGAALLGLTDATSTQLWWLDAGLPLPIGGLTALSVDQAGRTWLGAGTGYRVGTDAGWAPFDAGATVLGLASEGMTSLATDQDGRLCWAPGTCAQVIPGSFNATALSGSTPFFGGNFGALARGESDGGVSTFGDVNAVVNDLFVEEDAGAWATVGLVKGALWRRIEGRWYRVLDTPGPLLSVFRALGVLYVGSESGLQRLNEAGPTLTDAPMRQPDGGVDRAPIGRIRAFGTGAIATGRTGGIFELKPGASAWVRRGPSSAAAPCGLAGTIDAGGDDCEIDRVLELAGGAWAIAGAMKTGLGFLILEPDGGAPIVTYTPLRVDGFTTLSDGGLFACAQGSSLVLEGDLAAGLQSTSFASADGCFDAAGLEAGRVLVTRQGRFSIVAWDQAQNTWSSVEDHAASRVPGGLVGNFRNLGRAIPHGADVYVVGDQGAILRYRAK